MTVPSTYTPDVSTANGVTTAFPYSFLILDASHLVVEVGGVPLSYPSDYSVSGVGNPSGGTATLNVAPANGVTVSRYRVTPVERGTDYQNLGDLLADTLNADQDAPILMIQEAREELSRALRVPIGGGISSELPEPDGTKVLGWKVDNSGLRNVDITSPGGDLLLRSDLADPTGGAALVAYRKADGTGSTLAAMVREKLLASRTYYVRTDGSDSNTGLANTAGGAFLTMQKAANVIADTLDLNGFNVTVNVANGTYNAGVVLSNPFVGDGIVYFTGNTTTPANCVVNATGDAFSGEKGVTFDVRGFKVTATNRGIVAQTGAFISVGQMDFGACTGAQVEIGTQGQIQLGANYTISGGAASHLHASGVGLIFAGTITVTLTGTPAFVNYFAGAAQGSIVVKEVTYSGAATGPRFLSHKGATIETNPAFNPALPGNAEGRTWGGIYVGSTSVPLRYQANPTSAASLQIQGFRGISQAFVTHFETVTDPSGESRGYVYANGDGSYLSGRTSFGTALQVITSSGTNDGVTINAGGEINASQNGAPVGYFRRRGTDGTLMGFYKDLVFSGSISVSAGATAYNTSSDERIKNWIGGGYDADWILRVAAEIGEFTFKADPDSMVHTGARAQRLAQVEPLAVTVGEGNPGEEGFRPWGVDYSKLIPKLLLEVAALRARVDELEAGR